MGEDGEVALVVVLRHHVRCASQPGRLQREAHLRNNPTTWTILQYDGPDHLGLWYNALLEHQMALIVSLHTVCSQCSQCGGGETVTPPATEIPCSHQSAGSPSLSVFLLRHRPMGCAAERTDEQNVGSGPVAAQ